ncbi:MAG: diguanylate cyclase (GGDEF)-like protein/PAS domain S-box-containing protein [Sulfurimonas sp.]|jgi:diguanylate cyclase (GGDEF)-like protein/PAS domain S-box-containing protein|uniref:EAL domain-containing protein n=1 Tax=Sulfurimonas sp. TaxID=2022749 RepID=UPI0039E48048
MFIDSMKKFDLVTKLLLLSILVLILLFGYLVKTSNSIEEYDEYHNSLQEIELLDKVFDNFLLQKATFINYDYINQDTTNFDKNIAFLDSEVSRNKFAKEYTTILLKIKVQYKKKLEDIETFKSNNASLINSSHYLFELNKIIQNDFSLGINIASASNQTLLLLMKYNLNNYIDNKELNNNLNSLNRFLKESQHIEVDLFTTHVSKNIGRITKLMNIEKSLNKLHLMKQINELHNFLDIAYKHNLLIEKTITVIFFVVALIILFVLLMMYQRSLKIKDELFGFKSAIENSDNSIVITDINKNITYVNDLFERETGYKRKDIIGHNPRILKSGQMPQKHYDELNKKLDRGEKWEGEFVNIRKNKSIYYEKASIIPIFSNDKLVSYLAIKLNITEYIEKKREVEFLVYNDALTSLPNRSSIEEHIKRQIKVAKRNNTKMAVLFLDLDRFKIINDTLGHDVGDEILIESAKLMKQSLRDSDLLSRVGGDEFIIMLDTIDDEYSAAQVSRKILALFSEPIQTKQHSLRITLSIGISIFPEDGNDYKTICKHADIAMYKAKESGKNTFRYYKKELSTHVENRLNMEQSLIAALKKNEIYLVYQPQYNLKTKDVVGLEALVRWESDTLGNVPPDKFIPIAEETGLIVELGLYIFKQACNDFLIYKQVSKTLKTISINISAIQFQEKTIVDNLLEITQEVGIETKSIMLEITETHIMRNIAQSMSILKELKESGFAISIDDFGTGHSSLSYLKKFPIDELKIDKSFIDDIIDEKSDVDITNAIIALSNSLHYVNVAEGIETLVQEEFLLKANCLIGQGYYFSKPKKKEDLIQFLNHINTQS